MRKTKWNILLVAPALVLTFFCVQGSSAPRPLNPEQSGPAAKKEVSSESENYRVKYKVDEVENGKTINSRSYTMILKTDSTGTVRIGSRVPYSSGPTIHYQDVGMNIDCNIRKVEGTLVVHTKLDMSSVAGKGAGATTETNPVFGQFRLENFNVATVGKPAFVGSADDVASNRRYEIEVTVTRVR